MSLAPKRSPTPTSCGPVDEAVTQQAPLVPLAKRKAVTEMTGSHKRPRAPAAGKSVRAEKAVSANLVVNAPTTVPPATGPQPLPSPGPSSECMPPALPPSPSEVGPAATSAPPIPASSSPPEQPTPRPPSPATDSMATSRPATPSSEHRDPATVSSTALLTETNSATPPEARPALPNEAGSVAPQRLDPLTPAVPSPASPTEAARAVVTDSASTTPQPPSTSTASAPQSQPGRSAWTGTLPASIRGKAAPRVFRCGPDINKELAAMRAQVYLATISSPEGPLPKMNDLMEAVAQHCRQAKLSLDEFRPYKTHLVVSFKQKDHCEAFGSQDFKFEGRSLIVNTGDKPNQSRRPRVTYALYNLPLGVRPAYVKHFLKAHPAVDHIDRIRMESTTSEQKAIGTAFVTLFLKPNADPLPEVWNLEDRWMVSGHILKPSRGSSTIPVDSQTAPNPAQAPLAATPPPQPMPTNAVSEANRSPVSAPVDQSAAPDGLTSAPAETAAAAEAPPGSTDPMSGPQNSSGQPAPMALDGDSETASAWITVTHRRRQDLKVAAPQPGLGAATTPPVPPSVANKVPSTATSKPNVTPASKAPSSRDDSSRRSTSDTTGESAAMVTSPRLPSGEHDLHARIDEDHRGSSDPPTSAPPV